MLSLLLILLLIFVLWPLVRTAWRIWQQMRSVRRFMADPEAEIRRQAERQARARARYSGDTYSRTTESPRRRRRKKKIPRDVGEYVTFTEVEITETERRQRDSQTPPRFTAEEQVTDIKWVDIK